MGMWVSPKKTPYFLHAVFILSSGRIFLHCRLVKSKLRSLEMCPMGRLLYIMLAFFRAL